MKIYETIYDQLGGRKFAVMVGAYNMADHETGFSFRFKGSSKANYCKILLGLTDTYTVEFHRIWGTKSKLVRDLNMVYADDLTRIFEETTGLRTLEFTGWPQFGQSE